MFDITTPDLAYEWLQEILGISGEDIDLSKLKQSNLFVRLGRAKGLNDFNVNRYFFVSNYIIEHCKRGESTEIRVL